MSKCSKELDEVFRTMTANAEMMKGCTRGSNEWVQLNLYGTELYDRARSIFSHYHPEYCDRKPKTTGGPCD